jgi:hypothetical protein
MGTSSDRELIDPSEYCRALETYLCRKNEGHLIRIVGPVFEQVCGWSAQGVPLAIAFRGIDQYCERYYARGPRRRPVRIEFCEADILELFDAWRRAVGVSAGAGDAADSARSDRHSLPAHVDRAIARLTAIRAGSARSAALDQVLDRAVRELDRSRARAKQARGEERAQLIAHLAAVDRSLLDAAIAEVSADRRAALYHDANAEIEPFSARMASADRARSVQLAFERLLREELRLPVIAFE